MTGRGARVVGLVVVVTTALTMAACGGSGSSVGAGGGSPSAAVDGRQVYAARCASCHGANLEGTNKGPSHLSSVYKPGHHPDESFRRAIAEGSPQHHWNFGDMPPVQGMSDAEVTAVIAFIRAQQRERGFVD